jgi:endonuclease/exonuclease/phosphatase family metal-dependent hydrolase
MGVMRASVVIVLATLLPLYGYSLDNGSKVVLVNINMFCGFTVSDKIGNLNECDGKFSRLVESLKIAEAITSEIKRSDPEKRIGWMAREISKLEQIPDFIVVQEGQKYYSLAHLWPFYGDFLENLAGDIEELTGFNYDYFYSEDNSYDYGIIGLTDRQAVFYREGWEMISPQKVYQYESMRDGKNKLKRSLLGARFERDDGILVTLFTTHLETFEQDEVRLKQVDEALSFICGGNRQCIDYSDTNPEELFIFAGDFNCGAEEDAAYTYITEAGFTDAFAFCNPDSLEITCCNGPYLSNEEPFDHFRRPEVKNFCKVRKAKGEVSDGWLPSESSLILDERYHEKPWWPSDHAGMVTVFKWHE